MPNGGRKRQRWRRILAGPGEGVRAAKTFAKLGLEFSQEGLHQAASQEERAFFIVDWFLRHFVDPDFPDQPPHAEGWPAADTSFKPLEAALILSGPTATIAGVPSALDALVLLEAYGRRWYPRLRVASSLAEMTPLGAFGLGSYGSGAHGTGPHGAGPIGAGPVGTGSLGVPDEVLTQQIVGRRPAAMALLASLWKEAPTLRGYRTVAEGEEMIDRHVAARFVPIKVPTAKRPQLRKDGRGPFTTAEIYFSLLLAVDRSSSETEWASSFRPEFVRERMRDGRWWLLRLKPKQVADLPPPAMAGKASSRQSRSTTEVPADNQAAALGRLNEAAAAAERAGKALEDLVPETRPHARIGHNGPPEEIQDAPIAKRDFAQLQRTLRDLSRAAVSTSKAALRKAGKAVASAASKIAKWTGKQLNIFSTSFARAAGTSLGKVVGPGLLIAISSWQGFSEHLVNVVKAIGSLVGL